tara:strand:- start:939 stop:1343 length:405 start_codon:yes stop_codon:yes gene_type:complete
MCTQFKRDVMLGLHDLDTDTLKIALYTSSATLNETTTAYSATNEIANGSGYTTGGVTLANASVIINSTSGCFDSDNPEWTSATFTARGALIYNETESDLAIAVLDFGGDFSVAGGTFRIVFPAQTANTSIVRID